MAPPVNIDDLTKLVIALTGLASAISVLLAAKNSLHLGRQDKHMEQLSKDVNGRVTQLVESESAKAKLEAVQELGLLKPPEKKEEP